MPQGAIILWSGYITAIPAGFVLCDGANGTPDLRNRFVIGAGIDTGTGYTPTTTEYGAGFFTIGDHGGQGLHQLTIAEMPNHNHTVTSSTLGVTSYSVPSGARYYGTPLEYQWATEEIHSYLATTSLTAGLLISYTGGGQAHNTMPPYYALAYIMKT